MYWKAKEDKEIALVTGTEDDHRQRMRDYINTKRGSFVHKRTVLLKLFATLLKKYAGDGAKASKGSVVSAVFQKYYIERGSLVYVFVNFISYFIFETNVSFRLEEKESKN